MSVQDVCDEGDEYCSTVSAEIYLKFSLNNSTLKLR